MSTTQKKEKRNATHGADRELRRVVLGCRRRQRGRHAERGERACRARRARERERLVQLRDGLGGTRGGDVHALVQRDAMDRRRLWERVQRRRNGRKREKVRGRRLLRRHRLWLVCGIGGTAVPWGGAALYGAWGRCISRDPLGVGAGRAIPDRAACMHGCCLATRAPSQAVRRPFPAACVVCPWLMPSSPPFLFPLDPYLHDSLLNSTPVGDPHLQLYIQGREHNVRGLPTSICPSHFPFAELLFFDSPA